MSWLFKLSPRLWLAALTGIGLLLAGLISWALLERSWRAGIEDKYQALRDQAGSVVVALREATGNDAAGWASAPEQIRALGNSRTALLLAVRDQNLAVDEMAREAVRLRAHAEELQAIANRAEAQRRAALRSLDDLAITPGHRDDCEMLLAEANEALDLVREAGL